MSHSNNLRAPEDTLVTSRQQFIQSLEAKKQFNADCAIIIPELERLWMEKVIDAFDLTFEIRIEVGTVVNGSPLLVTQEGTNYIDWRHYLYNYEPQLLAKAITRLASRLTIVNGTPSNARGPVDNIPAYFKALVQDAARKRSKRGNNRPFVKPVVAGADDLLTKLKQSLDPQDE